MSHTRTPPTDISAVIGRAQDLDVELLIVPMFGAADLIDDVPGLDAATGGEIGRALSSKEFRARAYDTFVTSITASGWRAKRVALVGAGSRDDQNAERMRRVAAVGGYVARDRAAASAGWVIRRGLDAQTAATCAADGLTTAEFDGGSYKRADDRSGPSPSRIVIASVEGDPTAFADAVRRGRIVGEQANFARTLANEPGNVLTPREFAARVSAAASSLGLAVEVLDETRMAELGMRLLLGVAQGSAEPPRLIVVRHEPAGAPASPVFAFVGKGVTFDSGGISIKPADGMERMKDDMAGGAAVAAALGAIARLGGRHRVIGVIPTVENMPGGRATRPGDVVAGASGTSVEIINTDAEGRLILADALWYARRIGATHVVDIATLTGACMVALGRYVSGLFGRPDAWVEHVRTAAARGGDRVWPMPIYEETKQELKSDIADVINSAGRAGGAITAAAFLREFAGEGAWAHLDIAGTAWAEIKNAYQPKGATGVAVRTLVDLGMNG